MSSAGVFPAFSCVLAACLAVALPGARATLGADPAKPAPSVPGFDIPPAPRDPEFPLLPGAVTPLEAAPEGPAPMTGNVASVDVPQDAVRQPAVDTRDRSAESVAVTTSRGAAQPVAADGDSMWKMGAIWLAILGAVATLAVVAGLRRREAAGPVSVVRLVPHGRKGS